ncbi:MAG: 30S ribosomal protein S4, partial [Ruminococcus sp.]|nr:30S ribosomal protein S4 [Ruminococcus sp.]
MAVNKDPILKRCRKLGISPAVMGVSRESKRFAKEKSHKKVSEYGMQLNEKQKLKFIYGMMERPF